MELDVLPRMIKRAKAGVSVEFGMDHYVLTHPDGRKIKLTEDVNEAYYWGKVPVIDPTTAHMKEPIVLSYEWVWIRIPKDNVEQLSDFL